MRIVISGAGEIGTHLAEMLARDKHDIVVIDLSEENLKFADNHFDILSIQGSSTSFETLKEAKVKSADLLISVTDSEEVNILTAIVGKSLGAKKTIARIDTKEFLTKQSKDYFTNLGVDILICPENLAAMEIAGLLKQVGTTEVFEFSSGILSLVVIRLDEESKIIGKSLEETDAINPNFDFRAVAITRNNKTIIPKGNDVFQNDDFVYVVTNKEGIKEVLKYAGKEKFDIGNIMILGGSRIGKRAAKALEGHLHVKLIEAKKEKCFFLADFLEKTLVINGDGTNIALLKEEGLEKMDAFIAVTGNSETNILSCLLAKSYGVKKAIAEIENIDYIDLAENIGIDTIINKKLLAASHIFKYTKSADVASLRCLTGADAEVIELIAREGSTITKKQVKDLKFPKEAIIGGLVRENAAFIVKGNTEIIAGDKVVVFTLPSAINRVQEFFS
ncbi:MAG: Trk system potassium transporter TrkA [Bacteroidales bacterium]|nr:Trk system potassium transporter TrkA [Bacteroidales bacterium]